MIGPDVLQGKAFLTSASSEIRSKILIDFLKANSGLVGNTADQIDQLIVAADYKNPENDLSFVELEQRFDGIPVFRGEVKAGFAKDGSIIRVINNLAPGIDASSLSKDFGDPASAIKAAEATIGDQFEESVQRHSASNSTQNRAVFGAGDFATTAEKFYFPTEPGVAVPAWRVLIWQPIDAFYIIVDAKSGTLLWRKNITDRQTSAATYNVYANPTSMINVADNPFPMTPGPTAPNGTQGTAISRTSVTRIGNEAPYTFNNLGWISDGNNTTDGNNVEAVLHGEATRSAASVRITF
jgi:Zn-dependent metalloprotease